MTTDNINMLDSLDRTISTLEKSLSDNRATQVEILESTYLSSHSNKKVDVESLLSLCANLSMLKKKEESFMYHLSTHHSMRVKLKLTDALHEYEHIDISSRLDCIDNFRDALSAVSLMTDELYSFFSIMHDAVSSENESI